MQYYFCLSPAKVTNLVLQNLKFFLRQLWYNFLIISIVNTVRLPANYHLDNKIFTQNTYKMTDLNFFEDIHNSLEVYIWLSYKFEIEFVERELARILKDRVCKIIDSIIEKQAFDNWKDLKSESGSSHSSEFTKLLENNSSENEGQTSKEKESKGLKFTMIQPRKSNIKNKNSFFDETLTI